jgi:predicted transcriptional regulator
MLETLTDANLVAEAAECRKAPEELEQGSSPKRWVEADAYAGLLPPLGEEEFASLRADIEANGVRDPIWEDEDGNVLDGNHRLRIDPNAPRRVATGLTPAEKEAFVFRCNFNRRNLSPDQKREAHKKMKATAAKLREEDPKKWTQAKVAAALGVAQQTVSDWFPKATTDTGSGNGCKPPPRPDARTKLNPAAKQDVVAQVEAGKSQAQVAANYGVTQQMVSRYVAADRKKAEAEAEREARAEAAAKLAVDGFHLGDFRDVAKQIPDGTVNLIFTDPPYNREALGLYESLAEVAAAKLVDGGSLITYAGHYLIPEILPLLSEHLRYWWMLAVVHTGRRAEMREYGIKVCWKPLLWFVKGTRGDKQTFVEDAVASTMQKGEHAWQQSLEEARYYVGKLAPNGGLVFDPFCGGGTTAAACKAMGVRCVTCDTDAQALNLAKARVA